MKNRIVFSDGNFTGRKKVAKPSILVLFSATLLIQACATEIPLPPPTPESVEPTSQGNLRKTTLTIKGQGFFGVPVRDLSGEREFAIHRDFTVSLYPGSSSSSNDQAVDLLDVRHIDDNTLKGVLSQGVPAGRYGVRVVSPSGLSGEKDDLLEVVDSPSTGEDTDTFLEGDTDFGIGALDHFCDVDQNCHAKCADNECTIGCNSKYSCTYDCRAEECIMACRGAGTCEMTCSSRLCDVRCDGAGDCNVICNSSSCVTENNSSGTLTVNCSNSGGCNVACNGTGPCIMTCATDNCHLTCDNEYRECANSVYVCNAPCP
jgi:hypothetical protein